ncbi:MAG TPA: choice-of-anchor L domain-containing protein [Candidatus Omnitrophota bacterium]|nr:choice-of-anchor L domain-containing protein [Candidatus Omnitrophota bacterium]
MKRIIGIIGGVLTAALIVSPASALSVNLSNDGNALAQEILGSGITISNVTYTGASVASGTFTDGVSSGIGVESGIILTSGDASFAPGPNSEDGVTGTNYLSGDSDLDGLIPGYSTNDATILEFDFESAGGDLFFNYVFASDEYNEYTNSSFNDVFGFFVDDTNIALIPGTSTPVSINNVNGGNNPYGSNSSYPEYYNNNNREDGGPYYDLEYDGFTDVFMAQVLGLSAGTHHIKLAIADAGDYSLDSAVFIQSGTFSDEPTNPSIPEPSTVLLFSTGIAGVFLRKKRS